MGAMSKITTLALASVLSLSGLVSAGFDASSKSNLAVYWGQSSAGEGADAQKSLATYCDNNNINIIPIAFLLKMKKETMELEFSVTGGGCTKFGNGLFDCSATIGKDIAACQAKGKTILLSLGGDTYKEGGFASDDEAKEAAKRIWGTFGPKDAAGAYDRPFGDATVDGFDYDFEAPVKGMKTFGKELRRLMDTADGTYYLSAAPQCVFPETNYQDALEGSDGVPFDFIMVQHYNNVCGIQSFEAGKDTTFNFKEWDTWAKTSANPKVKVMLGIPASEEAAGSGYTAGEKLTGAIEDLKKYDSFGGVMMWDMSQLYANEGFLEEVVGALGTVPTGTGPTNGNAHGNDRQNDEHEGDDEELPSGLGDHPSVVNHALESNTGNGNEDVGNGDKPGETLTPPPGAAFIETGGDTTGGQGGNGDGQRVTDDLQTHNAVIPQTGDDEIAGNHQNENSQGANGWPTDGAYNPPAGVDDGKYRDEHHGGPRNGEEVVARRWVA